MADASADHVAFVGSIEWRNTRPFGRDDLAALLRMVRSDNSTAPRTPPATA